MRREQGIGCGGYLLAYITSEFRWSEVSLCEVCMVLILGGCVCLKD